jgi:CRISPR type IV-associated protein Csf3
MRDYARLPRSAFRPLRVTACLQCGVVSDPYLPLDGVLYYVAHRERYGAQECTHPGQSNLPPGSAVTLPLARCEERGPMWYYAASFAQWGPHADGQDHWNKRLDLSLARLIDFGGRRGTVDPASGRYKSYHMPVFYRHAVSVCWYVMGHQGQLEQLLRFATHLGKKTSQGWGAVLHWEVAPATEDWSVRGPGGQAMRAIPAGRGILTGFRPSYWLPKNQTTCEVPE